MKDEKMTLQQLTEAIEKYFDCALTDEQEQELRRAVAATDFSHPLIDEARALMGFRRPAAHKQRRGGLAPFVARAAGIAASLAVVVSLGVFLIGNHRGSIDSECFAYVNGQRVTDEESVLQLMKMNVSEFNEEAEVARRSLIEDLEIIAPAINEYESDNIFFENNI